MYDQILLKKLSEYFIAEEDVPATQLLYRDGELSLYVGGIDLLPGDKVVQYRRENLDITIDMLNEIPPLVKYTGEEWLEFNGFGAINLVLLFDLENQLKTAGKVSQKLGLVIRWINSILREAVLLEEPKSGWSPSPHTFNNAAKDALAILDSVQ
jgi:hypothetical protein